MTGLRIRQFLSKINNSTLTSIGEVTREQQNKKKNDSKLR